MKPIDLPIQAQRSFVDGPGGVSFTVMEGAHGQPCYVTRAALEVYFGADAQAPSGDAEATLRVFDAHVDAIHALARELRRRSRAGALTVVLTVDAIFRALTQGATA